MTSGSLLRAGLGLAAAILVAVAGCRGPVAHLVPPTTTSAPRSTEAVDPPVVALTSLEPPLSSLPSVDPATASLPVAPAARGISESAVAQLAAARSPVAEALERENDVPSVRIDQQDCPAPSSGDDFLRELRTLAAADARNKDAADAVILFYQLADAEGRGEVGRQSLVALDRLREAVRQAKLKGAKPPVDDDELDRQRATLLGLLGQAELGAKLLDGELKRRIGMTASTKERLQPSADFGVSSEPVDAAAAVAVALEKRPDLITLRTAYLKLTPDSLTSVKEYLRSTTGAAGLLGGGVGPQLPLVSRLAERRSRQVEATLAQAAAAEVEVRKRQLFALVEEKERAAADEVRAQVAVLTEQTHQVGLARWRAEKLVAKLAEVKKQDKGPAVEVPLELDVNRARADVIQAVMAWHQARTKLAAAQGLVVGGEVPPPPK